MKIYILLLFALTTFWTVKSQESPFEIKAEKTENDIKLFAINKSIVRQEIIFELTAENLDGYQEPITKLVNANDTILLVELTIKKGVKWQYKYTYNYLSKPTDEEIVLQNEVLKKATLSKLEEYKEGIVVFYKDGCTRCAFVTNYMLENDIAFKILNTTSDQDNSRLMWDLVRLEKPEIAKVTMPVVLINGEISYNIENLKYFSKSRLKPFK